MVLSGMDTLHRSIAGLGPRYALPLFMSPRLFYPIAEEIARAFSEKSAKTDFSAFLSTFPGLVDFFGVFWNFCVF